jgi:hypothetical protein
LSPAAKEPLQMLGCSSTIISELSISSEVWPKHGAIVKNKQNSGRRTVVVFTAIPQKRSMVWEISEQKNC